MSLDLSGLNPQQLQAVLHGRGPALVLAGAGSGKTRVVTYRTARLLADGVDPARIVVVTFTNKAAAEMRGRILEMVGESRGRDLTLSTFHSLGHRLLRRYIDRLGYRRSFTILDGVDQLRMVKEAVLDLGLQRTGARPEGILRIISRAKRERTSPAGLRQMLTSPLLPYAQRIFGAYQRQLMALNAVDFDDLLVLPLALCDSDDEVCEAIGRHYEFVMVDEYQDTNPTQLAFLRRIAPHHNLVAVGDDDQSIYAFQGADADHILDFERVFAGARIVKLEQNYRSTSRILSAANALIANNGQRHEKTLWSARGQGSLLRYVSLSDERTEAAFVARDVRARHDNEGVAYDEMAVLFRINAQSLLYEEALRLHDVPYRVVGATELFDRAEVRDWLAYLKVALNPHDDLSLRRILNVPRRGLGSAAVAQLEEHAKRTAASLASALRQCQQLSDRARQGAAQLLALVNTHRGDLRRLRGLALAAAARSYIEASGLRGHIRRTEKSAEAAAQRVENLDNLIEGMGRNDSLSLIDYLASVSLDGRAPDRREEAGRGVTLLTIHSAKGLEFGHVYLVGLEEGLLPHKRSLDRAASIAEERRLCYVGMTRAMERLTLTAARTRTRRGERLPRQPSRFLDEIPSDLLEEPTQEADVESEVVSRTRARLAEIQEMLGRSRD